MSKYHHNHPKWEVDFKSIKEGVGIEEVGRILGLKIKNHVCSCPFHEEKTPSLRFYVDHYYCFGCGASGDSISLTSKLLNVRPIEAVKVLNNSFHLGYDLTRQATYKATRERKTLKRKEDLYLKWYRATVLVLSKYIQICHGVINAETFEPWMTERARTEAERVEALQDTIIATMPQEAYRLFREEVDVIDKRIQRGRNYAAGFGIEN
jgi:hypothetical protein